MVTSELQPQVPGYKAPSRKAEWLAPMFLPPWANGPTPAQTFADKYPIKPSWGPEAPDMSAGQAILFKALEGFHTPCLPGSPLVDSGAH